MKQLQIRIFPDGKIEGQTIGIKGRKCLDYISQMEELTGARVADSAFTHEYEEQENIEILMKERIGETNGI